MAILVPAGHFIDQYDAGFTSVSFLMASAAMAVCMVPYIVACYFYYKILRYARNQVAIEEAVRKENGPTMPMERVTQGSVQQDIHGAIFDDSGDDDIIDPSEESPSSKQESASMLAFKAIIPMWLSRMLCVALFVVLPYSVLTFGTIAAIMLLTRHPFILLISIINFGPLRNTVGVYIDNLPDHIMSFVDIMRFGSLCSSSSDDQRRSIVSDESDATSSASDDDKPKTTRVGVPSGISAVGSPRSNAVSPIVVGERVSAVSPSSSPDRGTTDPPAMTNRPNSASLPAVLC